jgi:hypothetical protein
MLDHFLDRLKCFFGYHLKVPNPAGGWNCARLGCTADDEIDDLL